MSSKSISAKRRKAIAILRDTGMTDAEIEAQLGHSLEQEEIIDAEIVSVEEAEAEQAKAQKRGSAKGIETPTQAELSAATAYGSGEGMEQETESGAECLPVKAETAKPRDWSAYSNPDRQCTAHSTRTGQRCKNAAILGGTTCKFHGSGTTMALRKAKERIEQAADRMAGNLLGIAETADSETVRLSATNSALDRAGIIKPTQVQVGPMEPAPWESVFESISTESREASRARRGYSPEYGTGAALDDPFSAGQSSKPPKQTDPHYATPMSRSDEGPDNHHAAGRGFDTSNAFTGYDGMGDPGLYDMGMDEEDDFHTFGGRPRPQPPRRDSATDDDALYLAKLANERAGAYDQQRAIEGGHRKYRAHRRPR